MAYHRIEAIITGRVQAVGFRRFVHREARKIGGLLGFAENLKDKSVKVIAQGDQEKLKQLIKRLHVGPLIGNVEKVKVTWTKSAQIDNPPAGLIENKFGSFNLVEF